MTKIAPYKFSETAREKPELEIDNAEEFLKEKFSNRFSFGMDNITHQGIFKLMGWLYDFRPVLNRYVVKQYGYWNEYYAPNKTMLRSIISGKINKIIEV